MEAEGQGHKTALHMCTACLNSHNGTQTIHTHNSFMQTELVVFPIRFSPSIVGRQQIQESREDEAVFMYNSAEKAEVASVLIWHKTLFV